MESKCTFFDFFSDLPDPRIQRCRKHDLLDILFLSVCAVLSGAEGWECIVGFGHAKLEWLRRFVPLEHGIPSDDTIARVISRLDSEAFNRSFLGWVQAVAPQPAGDVIAIDGKTIRRSFDSAREVHALHMVSAWSCANRLVLGQQRTSEKSNEITAIPALLYLLTLNGCIVTIDAMGCQKHIASHIRDKRGHYVLAFKKNQKHLYEDIQDAFEVGTLAQKAAYVEALDKGHGRIERRCCWVLDAKKAPEAILWPGAKSVVKIQCERHIGDKTTRETRYFISSLGREPEQILAAVRCHWEVENVLHWVLDVSFREDDSRIRREQAAENMGVLRKMARNICQKTPTKHSNKMKIRVRGWDDNFREKMIFGFAKS